MMSAFIKMDNIEKYYESSGNVTKAIDRISFEIKEGEFIGIMGESGSGKTSLLNILGTVDTATAGHIYFDGKDWVRMDPTFAASGGGASEYVGDGSNYHDLYYY